jgi:hypothetical protein
MLTKVHWYQVFSNWIFVASVLYPFHKVSTFPLLLLAFPFGVFYLIRKWKSDSFFKLVISCIVHFVPFLFIPRDFTAHAVFLNMLLGVVYVTFMYYNGVSISEVYRKIFSESHKTMKSYFSERV